MKAPQKKKGRPPGSRNALPVKEKAEALFKEVCRTFDQDLTKTTPNERINATIQLANILIKHNEIQKISNPSK